MQFSYSPCDLSKNHKRAAAHAAALRTRNEESVLRNAHGRFFAGTHGSFQLLDNFGVQVGILDLEVPFNMSRIGDPLALGEVGKATGMLPPAMDCSDRTETAAQVAIS